MTVRAAGEPAPLPAAGSPNIYDRLVTSLEATTAITSTSTMPRPAKVTVTFGKPLRFEPERGTDRKAQYEIASREMMDAISRLREGIIAGTGQGRRESVRVVGGSGK